MVKRRWIKKKGVEGGKREVEKRKILGLGSEVIQSIGEQKVPRRKKLLWGQRSKKWGSEVMFVNVKVNEI